MVRIVIETDGSGENDLAVASREANASGDAGDAGAGPGGTSADLIGNAPADAADGGAPPAWLTAAIEAAERGSGGGGQGEASEAADGGAAPQL